MIPMIWLINVFLINYWFMDGWPGWKLAPSSEAVREPLYTDKISWTPRFVRGLAVGIGAAVAIYFFVISILPWCCEVLTIIE